MARISRASKENLVYVALVLVLWAAPVATMVVKTASHAEVAFDWEAVLHVWAVYLVFLVPFLIHNFLLAPTLIYKGRRRTYMAGVVALLVLFFGYQHLTRPVRTRHRQRPRHEWRQDNAPRHHATPPRHHGKTEASAKADSERPPEAPPEGKPRPPFFFEQFDLLNTFTLVLLLGMNLGIKLYFKQEADRKRLKELEHENLEQQLEYLKFQINPHFFMNTLNNIHALVDIDPEKAKKSIVVLSRMMRYLLYESNDKLITLDKELDFVRHYIALMRLRYTDHVRITVSVPDRLPDGTLPPLTLFTFVENAFKHGVTYQADCFIDIAVEAKDERLHLRCRNSKAPKADSTQGGVGLKNVTQRLGLIYGDRYELTIRDTPAEYDAHLCLPLNVDVPPATHDKTEQL